MNVREDIRMSLRSLRNHMVETILLVIGIALGIGATTAGVNVLRGVQVLDNESRQLPVYREIVVRPTENAQTLELAAVSVENEEPVRLSATDLSAADEAPDVAYAYIMNATQMRIITPTMLEQFGTFGGRGGTGTGDGSGGGGSVAAGTGDAPGVTGAPSGQPGDPGVASAPAGQPGDPNAGQPGDPGEGPVEPTQAPSAERPSFEQTQNELTESLASIDNPQPVLDEITGYAVTEQFFAAYNLQPANGSIITADDVDRSRDYVVLGSNLGKTLFQDGVSVGRQFMGNRDLYTVIGVLEPTGTSFDNRMFRPAEVSGATGRRFGGPQADMSVRYMVAEAETLNRARQQLETHFDREYGTGTVAVETNRAEFEFVQDRNRRISAVILLLGLAGFLIAAVNVSNILYTRAVKKQRNAGILKALGATRGNVFQAFFAEGFSVAALGALAGAGVSIGLSALFSNVMGVGFASLGAFLPAMVAAVAMTTAFTAGPAIQVSRISAADAIRYE